MNLHFFKLCLAYSNSLKMSSEWLNFPGVDYLGLQRKMLSLQKNFVVTFSRGSHVGMAKKCTRKHNAYAELLFCSANLLPF